MKNEQKIICAHCQKEITKEELYTRIFTKRNGTSIYHSACIDFGETMDMLLKDEEEF